MRMTWLMKDLSNFTSLSYENFAAAKNTLLVQVLLVLLSGSILDGGEILRVVLLAAVAWWIGFLPILCFRPATQKQSDRFFLKFGFLLFLPISLLTEPIWGWLRGHG